MSKSSASFSILLGFLLAVACSGGASKKTEEGSESSNNDLLLAEGKELLESHCYSCHNPKASHKSRLAPPMFAVKKHYMKGNSSEEDFTNDIISFLNDPSKKKAKMKGAVEKFNLMPKLSYKEEDIKKIASYLYHAELEKPEGHDKKGKKGKGGKGHEQNEHTSYLEKGQEIALGTKKILGKNLIGAINNKGTDEALSFCSEKAIHLTDSMANELNAKVKRVSDQNRNPDNKASQSELAYIQESKQRIKEGKKPKPQILEKGDHFIGYYQIMTNKMCLQCHGKPNQDIIMMVEKGN
jgi:mono/diheme cytochrome c family protein